MIGGIFPYASSVLKLLCSLTGNVLGSDPIVGRVANLLRKTLKGLGTER